MTLTSSCCSFVFSVLLWILKKTLGFNLKELFSSSNGSVCSIRCKGCSFLFEDVIFVTKLWNSILLNNNAPVRINYGSIGYSEIRIGWLLFGRITIHIKEINFLLNTTNERRYNYELEAKKMIKNKKLLLRKLKQSYGKQVQSPDDDSKPFGRIARMLLHLLLILARKIEIQVEDVHVRLEEKNTVSDIRTSLGVTVKKLALHEDKSLRKSAVPASRWCTAKQFAVSMFSFYWNPDERIMYTDLMEDEKKERLKVISYQRRLGHSYVLYPCSPSLCVTVAPGVDAFVKTIITCKMDSIMVNVSKNQLRVATILFGHINHLQNTIDFLKYRPQPSIFEQPRQWWIYAFKCIRFLQKSSKWDWLEVKEERQLKQKYYQYYSELLQKKGSKKQLVKQLQSLEEEMSVLGTLLTKRKVERDLPVGLHNCKRTKMKTVRVVLQSMYSLSGQCNVGNIEVSLLADSYSSANEEIEIFTVKVYSSYFSLTKEHQQSCIIVKVEDAVCLGVDCVDGYNQERSSILACDKDSGKEVLSVKLAWIDSTISNGKDESHFNYHVSTYLHPTILHFDWTTVHKLAEFSAIVRGTHKDLREAVKARVKEVGHESKLRFRHFIANKERASIDAVISLPVIVFDTPKTPYRQLSCHFGTLNVQTIKSDCSTGKENIQTVLYKVCLKDAKLSLSSVEVTFDILRAGDFCSPKDSNLLTFATLVSDLRYTTYIDSYLPSNLRTSIQCPEMYFCLINGESEAMTQFCYNQFDFVIKTINAFNSDQSASQNKSNALASSSSQIQSCFTRDRQSNVLPQMVDEEEADFRSKEDSTIFVCEASLDLVRIRIKESDTGGPHILLAIRNVLASCQLQEQATHFTVKMASLQLIDHTHKDEYDESIKVLFADSDFLNFSSCSADPNAFLFSSQYQSIEDLYRIELNPLTCSLHYEFLNNLLVWMSEINIPPFNSLLLTLWPNEDKENKTDTYEYQVIDHPPPSGDTVQSLCTIIAHLITVTLDTSHSSSLLTATIHDVNVKYCNKYRNGTIDCSIQRFVLTDELIVYDSPYHVIIANSKNEPLVNLNVYYELGNQQVFIKCEAAIGSVKIVYLHKLIRNLQIIFMTLLKRYTMMREECSRKLNSSKGLKNVKRISRANKSKSSDIDYSYQGSITVNKCSVKIPRDSHHPDALTVKGRQLKLFHGSTETTTTTTTTFNMKNIEEPDTDPSHPHYHKNSSQSNNTFLRAIAEDIELNWNFGSMKRTIAKTNSFSIDRDSSCLIISLDLIKVFLTGENLASVPGLIGSNFSEKDVYALKIIEHCSLNKPRTHHNKPIKQQNTEIPSEEEIFNPFLKIIVSEWVWMIQNSDGIRDITMATVELTNSTITIGSLVKFSKDTTNDGVAVKLCVNNVSGVEGEEKDNRQKILTKYGLQANGDNQPTNVLEVTVHSLSNEKPEIMIGLGNVCLCVWPTFLHCLIKFKNQIKLKEGRRGKWWKTRRRSTVATLVDRLSIISNPMFTPDSKDTSSTQGFCIRIGLETCCIAILENPSSYEVTTPGAVIEFQSNEHGVKEGQFQLEYHYTTANCWSFIISSCWFHGSLCLFGENILPLTKVLPPSNLSLQYIVENTHNKLIIALPLLECHITNELFQVIQHFYETFNKQSHVLSTEASMSLISDDIWSIKDFNRLSVLPEIPSQEETDSYDDMLSSDDEEDDDNEEEFKQEQRQQEAYIDFNDVTINFDLVTSGDRDSIPVMCLHTCSHCVVSQWSTQLIMDVGLTLESFIYNERRGAWEPLIEPIHNAAGTYKPYTLNIKLFQVFDLLPGEVPSTIPASPSFSSIHDLKDSISIGSGASPMIGKGNRSGFIKSSSMAGDQLSSSSLSPQSSPVPRIRHTQPARTRLSPRNNNEDTTDTSDDSIFFRSNRDQKSFKKSSSMASDQFSMSSISPRTSPNMRKRHAQSSRSRITKRDYSPDNNSVNKTGEDNLSLKSTEEQSSHSTYVLLLTSADRLELTVTPSALKTIQMYSQMLGVNYHKSMEHIRNCVQDSRPPVRIENKSGLAIKVYPGPTFKEGDTEYSNPFVFHIRTLKHFPSMVGNRVTCTYPEETDTESQLVSSSLFSIPEELNCSPSLQRVSRIRRTQHSTIYRSPSPSDDCIPLHFDSILGTCSIEQRDWDDESYCDNVSFADDDINVETSLSSALEGSSVIPVIEGSMFDALEEEEEDDEIVDGSQGIEDQGDYHVKRRTRRQRKKSVFHLKLMKNVSTAETDNDTTKGKEKENNDYWRPKLLRKTHKIKLQLFNSTKSSTIPVALPGVFAVPIKHEEFGQMALLCEVSLNKGVRKVVIKSGLQIRNSLRFQVAIYSLDESSKDLEKLGEIGSDRVYDVPIQAVANKNMVLKFGAGSDGIPCNQSVHWKTLSAMENRSQILVCPQSVDEGDKYFFQASIKLIPAVHQTLHSPSHIITLESALVIHNHLPIPIDVVLQFIDTTTTTIPSQLVHIDECESDPLDDLPPKGSYIFRFSFEYHNLSYSGECDVNLGSVFKRTVKVIGYDKKNHKTGFKMYFNIRATLDSPHIIHVFTPYWIVNKTNIDLEFEHQPSKSRIHNVCSKKDRLPLLVTYVHKSGRINEHKIKLRVINGEWSKLFVLGAVGKIVNVTSVCRKRNFPHEFAIETHLLDSTLTEIVYVMPKYSIINYTDATLLFASVATNGEIQRDTAVQIQPPDDYSTCTFEPFWPGKYDVVDLSLVNEDTPASFHSQRYKFSLSMLSPTVIKTVYEALPVVTVRIQPDPTRGTTVVSIRSTVVGAMVKIQNLCRLNCIRFTQRLTSGAGQLYPLNPNQSILYTWDCPVGKREINWQLDGAKDSSWKAIKFDKPKQFGTARVVVKKQDNDQDELVTVIWSSAFEGSQLVLRFLDNPDDYKHLSMLKTQSSPDDIQFFCSLEGIGVSLVDNTPKEVAYFTITSSPVLWTKKRPKAGAIWTVINKEHSEQLETALRMGQSSIIINDEKYDLDKMIIVSQKSGELCCSFNPGVWVWYSQCDSHQLFNMKLGKVQIDNQLTDTELSTRVVFSESRHTGDLHVTEVGAPFLDLQVSISMHGKNAIREYEKVLLTIKPCQVNMELGIIAALLPFANTTFAKDDVDQNYEMDQLDVPLCSLLDAENLVAIRTLNYVDALQINQTSVAVTYTTAGEYDMSSEWGKVVNAIIHFALITQGSFNISLKSVQIINEITDLLQMKRILYGHYKNEIFWQFQHFALGLDVIGNPAKLFNSFQTGAKDLVFKSKEGISEGETGYGIALGMKSLLGHVVGGSANSISLSTGSLSSVLLAATDLHYQREHRHMRQTRDIPGIVLGGKFFLKGMFRGTTDIFVLPTTGAVHDGVEGFFKGLGKGTVSILVKPTLGLVDLAKYTMEGVRSAVDDEMAIQTVRRPRLLQLDKEMKPFNTYEAEGLYILNHLSQPLSDEYYIGHCWQPVINPKHVMVIMVTSKQLLQLYKADKQYCIEWSMSVNNIEKVQATTYQDEDHPTEEKPGLFLRGVFNKSKKEKTQQVVLRMDNQSDVKDIKEKLQAVIKNRITD